MLVKATVVRISNDGGASWQSVAVAQDSNQGTLTNRYFRLTRFEMGAKEATHVRIVMKSARNFPIISEVRLTGWR
jgi:hypothetical protein